MVFSVMNYMFKGWHNNRYIIFTCTSFLIFLWNRKKNQWIINNFCDSKKNIKIIIVHLCICNLNWTIQIVFAQAYEKWITNSENNLNRYNASVFYK